MNSILSKGKNKDKNSSLKNLKIMPKNLNEIVLSWIPSLYLLWVPWYWYKRHLWRIPHYYQREGEMGAVGKYR